MIVQSSTSNEKGNEFNSKKHINMSFERTSSEVGFEKRSMQSMLER